MQLYKRTCMNNWPQVELPLKNSWGDSLAGIHAHAHTSTLHIFCIFVCCNMCVSCVCAETRPGHLRGIWGRVALSWAERRMEKRNKRRKNRGERVFGLTAPFWYVVIPFQLEKRSSIVNFQCIMSDNFTTSHSSFRLSFEVFYTFKSVSHLQFQERFLPSKQTINQY